MIVAPSRIISHPEVARVTMSGWLEDGTIVVMLNGDVVARVYQVPGVNSDRLAVQVTDCVYAWLRSREGSAA